MTIFSIPNPPAGVGVEISLKALNNNNFMKLMGISFNFADEETRRLVECLYKNLKLYQASIPSDEPVKLDPSTSATLHSIFKKNNK